MFVKICDLQKPRLSNQMNVELQVQGSKVQFFKTNILIRLTESLYDFEHCNRNILSFNMLTCIEVLLFAGAPLMTYAP